MIAGQEYQLRFLIRHREQRSQFVNQRFNRKSTMDDIAQKNEPLGLIVCQKVLNARKRVVFGGNWEHLALGAMGPGIAQMQIGDGKNLFRLEIDSASRVEGDAEKEFDGLKFWQPLDLSAAGGEAPLRSSKPC